MNRMILTAVMILLFIGFASAQGPLAEIVFGRLDGDSAGTLLAFRDSTIEVEVWMRTAPGIMIESLHLPLSSNNIYISARDGGNCSYYPLAYWEEQVFLPPNADTCNPGKTNQSFIGTCSTEPDSCQYFIETQGVWWRILEYFMISADSLTLYDPLCDAFNEGCHPENGGLTLVDHEIGQMDPSTYTIQYSCLEFVDHGCGHYVVGDYNGNGVVNIADVVEMWSRLKTGSPLYPQFLCDCPPGVEPWSFMGDVNGSCTLNVADVVILFNGRGPDPPELIPCPFCPPEE